jgi:hypothetical protein
MSNVNNLNLLFFFFFSISISICHLTISNFHNFVFPNNKQTMTWRMSIVIWAPLCALIVLQLVNTSNAITACEDAETTTACARARCCNSTAPCRWRIVGAGSRKRDETAPVAVLLEDRKRQQWQGSCSCNSTCCPAECTVSMWSEWSSCTVPCGSGSGSRTRTRIKQLTESCGGRCVPLSESESCSAGTGGCPTSCQVSSWSAWICSTSCGPGIESRSRSIAVPEANGGSCPERANLTESRSCDAGCCPTNCVVGNWSAWSACSASCGGSGGSQSRTRNITQPSCGGTCSATELEHTRSCNDGCCTYDCVWAAYGAWSSCSVTCGMGTQTRVRTVQTAEACGGLCPGDAMESQMCTQPACALSPVDCIVSMWSAWSACSTTCGATKARTRSVTQAAENGGIPCPTLNDSELCNSQIACSNSSSTGAENELPQVPHAASTDIALIAGVAGAIGAVIIVAIIVIIVVVMKRRRSSNKNEPPVVAATATATDEFVSARESTSIAMRTHIYDSSPTQTNYVTSAQALSNPQNSQFAHYNTLDATEI